MPTKNVAKVFVSDSFYCVDNRGWNLGKIFIDEEDWRYFESLLICHLLPTSRQDKLG